MNNRRILVSGASIAGLTAAYWLFQHGFDITVIERANELRLGGQNIDIKGPAWEIIRKMGLEEKIKAANTTEIGIRFVNTDNKVVAQFAKEDAFSMTQELEILRGDLVQILYNEVKDNSTFRFGSSIKSTNESDHGVDVTFKDGLSDTFDAVIIAEGIGSSTRHKVFGDEVKFRFLGLYTSYFTTSHAESDSRWARWCNTAGGIVFLIRPDNYGNARVCINFRSPELGYEKLTKEQQKELLIGKIKEVGWEAPRLVEGIKMTDDLYLERLSQVQAPRWHKGRVAMVGDAAYCVTPIGGKGTDLAISGAYILAGELATRSHYTEAFKAYESKLRPFVHKVQKLPPGVPGLVYPWTKTGVAILNGFFGLAGSRPVKFLTKLFGGSKAHPKQDLILPEYNRD